MKTEITEEHGLIDDVALDAECFDLGVMARGIEGCLYLRAFDGDGVSAWVLVSDTLTGSPLLCYRRLVGYLVTMKSATVVRK